MFPARWRILIETLDLPDDFSSMTLPQMLQRVLTELERRYPLSADEDLIEFHLASFFLWIVLGEEWHRRHITLASNPDSWMLNGNDAWCAAHPTRRLVYHNRVVRLADAIFTVSAKKVVGADGLLKRLRTRPDTRASFTEAEIASLLAYNGCLVSVVDESGIRGEDFDLLCVVDGVEVSAEVTAISERLLTVQTILNKLGDKRNQVPPHRPAALYLHIPAIWMRDEEAAAPIFGEAVEKFLRRSQRFNIIVILFEEVIPFLNGGFPTLWMKPVYNNRPRHIIPEVEAFTNGRGRMAKSLLASCRTNRDQRLQG
jgi:hypothetical protein